ncbi:IclR family transcriptional regulator [Novosphingobium album (ex Liu et al. 2023)]|uniref:IclR family transcriptional regulator n=1 Tax=Novosphingobium album (ex Liu et al. 2023) TaxID=3031130 RepID=A0ABT5WQV4_9SPHN|nr:IclR family transcriptional regulator [Novosphingobium album (ex Liu et al. 2023)]MDE8652435.1 IclR family transcriptional regulator [Novosphingobium album (ex Liu et al. 2023)]
MATKSASTLAKGLHLLSAIIADEGRTSMSMVAKKSGIPLPTAHRLALTLEEEGFLVRVRKGYYHPGPALSISREPTPEAQVAVRLRRPLARLARTYDAFTHFGILDDGMVTYLVRETGTDGELFTAERIQLEAYCSAIGKILLAGLAPGELDAYLANGPFVALTRNTLTDPAEIRRELDEVRARGLAFDRFEIRDDLFCIAVPVMDSDGFGIGAISVSVLGAAPDTPMIARLRRALRKIAASASMISAAHGERSVASRVARAHGGN